MSLPGPSRGGRLRLGIVHPEIESFDEYHGGAIARWTAEIARRAPPWVDLDVITKRPRSSPYRGVRARVVPIRTSVLDRIPGARRYAIHWFTPEMRHYVRHGRYDVLHVHARPQWVLPLRSDGFTGRLLLHLQNDHLGSWLVGEKEELLSHCDRVLCCSDYIRRRTVGLETIGDPTPNPISSAGAARVVTLHNGVDTARFHPPPAPRDATALATIAYLGRVVPEKAPHLTMEAVLRLRREGLPARMMIVGAHDFGAFTATPYIARLREIAARDPSAFRFAGYVHHRRLPEVLGYAGIYVHACTWQEPFGLATVEAMSCGLAPLASRRGGNPEVVGDEEALFDLREDPDSIVALLGSLIRDPSRTVEHGRRARERARTLFDWDRIASDYFAGLRSLCS